MAASPEPDPAQASEPLAGRAATRLDPVFAAVLAACAAGLAAVVLVYLR